MLRPAVCNQTMAYKFKTVCSIPKLRTVKLHQIVSIGLRETLKNITCPHLWLK